MDEHGRDMQRINLLFRAGMFPSVGTLEEAPASGVRTNPGNVSSAAGSLGDIRKTTAGRSGSNKFDILRALVGARPAGVRP